MIRFLLLLLLVGCGPEDEMARVSPRVTGAVILNKAQERINAQRTAAEQDSAYQPEAFVRPATLDAADAAGSSSFLDGGTGGYIVSRLKNIVRKAAYTHIDFRPAVFAMTAEYVLVVCRYEDEAGLIVKEMMRAAITLSATPNDFESVQLPQPLFVYPGEKYAIGIIITPIDVSIPGAKFAEVIGVSSVSSPPLFFTASSEDEVGFSIPYSWDGSPRDNVAFSSFTPLAVLSRGRAIDRWY